MTDTVEPREDAGAPSRPSRSARHEASGRAARRARAQARDARRADTAPPAAPEAAGHAQRALYRRRALIAAGALLAVLLLVAGLDLLLSAGCIHPGVRVGSVSVGRMDVPEAAAAIARDAHGLLDEPVVLTAGGEQWQVTSGEVSASVDATALAEDAYRVGRSRSFGTAVAERLSAWFGGKRFPIVATLDPAALDTLLNAIDEAVGTPAVDAAVVVNGTDISVTPDSDGTGVDREAAATAIAAAFTAEERTAALDLIARPAAIAESGAVHAADVATRMLSAPVKLTYEAKTWTIEPAVIAEWLAFRPVTGESGATELECYLAGEEVTATVLPLAADVGKLAKDATFKTAGGTVSIVPHQDGLGLNGEDLVTLLTYALTGTGERTVELPMERTEPAITTDDAKAMGIKERLATFTTDYSSTNRPRVNNIHTLADALDGTLVPPGGVFSFNGTIGPRTAEKGYQEANAIVNGKLVPELGGGVCQVATTMFNSIFFSGLPVVERRNHSLYISHYPKGRDAAVSWGGPDVKFRNDTDHWVLVATAYTNSTVTISLYGTDPGYEVSYKTGEFTDFKDYPVREIKDATLPVGTRIIDEKGVRGRSITVTRTVTKNGTVVRTDSFKSTYKASEEVVRVGTKVVEPSKPTTTTAQ